MVLPLAISVGSGLLLGKLVLPRRVGQSHWVGRAQTALMVMMLIALGVRLAVQQATSPDWARMFGRALALALGCIAGSVLFTWPCAGWLPAPEAERGGVKLPNPLNLLGLAVGSLIAGIIVGAVSPGSFPVAQLEGLAFGCLVSMLFLVGVDGGSKESVGSDLKVIRPRLLLVPVAIAAGSTAGGCLVGMVLGFAARDGAGIGAGCGWYSYTTIILGKAKDAELGSYALLANLLREALSLLVIPVMARWHRGLMLLAPAGCTAMDTTLKMLSQLGGTQLGVMAFLSGMICSLLVPELVPFVFHHLPAQ